MNDCIICRDFANDLTRVFVLSPSAVLQVLHETFPQHTFLMNGLIQGVKVRGISIWVAFKIQCLIHFFFFLNTNFYLKDERIFGYYAHFLISDSPVLLMFLDSF